MQQSRAAFKLALRYCRQHEIQLRADESANSLTHKDFKGFWKSINNTRNDQATTCANVVGRCVGESSVTSMWKNHFEQLYNSISDNNARDRFYERIIYSDVDSTQFVIAVKNVIEACKKQKKNKAAGLDGLHMEAFIYGSDQLIVHICVLFITYCYIPQKFMSSMIVPLIKCRTGDLADVNNYRAIAISNAVSKLFESVISNEFVHAADGDEVQFGFKPGHSTSVCTNMLKRTTPCPEKKVPLYFCL